MAKYFVNLKIQNPSNSMKEILIQIHQKDFATLGSVRTLGALQVAKEEQYFWIRGIAADNIPIKVRQLPATATYHLDEALRLFPLGKITPVGKLKNLDWLPISKFVEVEFPKAALAGKTNLTQAIKIIPSENTQEGNALLTNLSVWKKFANEAATIRLEKIKYAVSETSEVLILGTPLIPIPGKEFWIRNHILLPNGFDFEYPILAEVIQQQLNPKKDGILLFHKNGTWEKILNTDFVKGTRSAIRNTPVR